MITPGLAVETQRASRSAMALAGPLLAAGLLLAAGRLFAAGLALDPDLPAYVPGAPISGEISVAGNHATTK